MVWSKRVLRTVSVGGVGIIAFGGYQGLVMRRRFNESTKLQPPTGPTDGNTKWETSDPLNSKLLKLRQKSMILMDEIKLKISQDGGIGEKLIKEMEELKQAIRAETDEIMSKILNTRSVLQDKMKLLKFQDKGSTSLHTSPAIILSEGEGIFQGNQDNHKHSQFKRKIRLLVIGDSLVCGVGCDDGDVDGGDLVQQRSPVLPQVLARALSVAMQADVRWQSRGIIGADIKDIRSTIMPQIIADLNTTSEKEHLKRCDGEGEGNGEEEEETSGKDDEERTGAHNHKTHGNSVISSLFYNPFRGISQTLKWYVQREQKQQKQPCNKESSSEEDEGCELIVVVICGLNDWKGMLERFPFGQGPVKFREELRQLIDDIKQISAHASAFKSCKVVLPAMPVSVAKSDRNFIAAAAPLRWLFEFFCSLWDNQKATVAMDDETHTTLFVKSPQAATPFATPGEGNISSDGVHPSKQGYRWWGIHIASEIVASFL